MKKLLLLILTIIIVIVSTGCSSPSDNKYAPQIIGSDSLLTDSLEQLFVNFDYPAGLVPVMVLEPTINDLLRTSAHGDDVFDEISDERDADNFEDFGLLIYITQEPRLIQLRLGDHYQLFADLCGVTSGQRYLELQQRFSNDDCNSALDDLLYMACENVKERNNLCFWQRGQLTNLSIAINHAMQWFGTPSQNFYGTMVAKPIYMCISCVNKLFGSWLMGIVLVFVVVFALRWVINWLLRILIPSQKLQTFINWLFGTVIGVIYSFSAVGCAMYFSSGRLEDLHAIKAFGIPNVEAFISDPSMFVQESNFWIAGAFMFLTMLAISLDTFCSDNMVLATENINLQMAKWNSLDKSQQNWLLGLHQVEEIKSGQTPYQAIFAKMTEKMNQRTGLVMSGLAVGALFFFPKAVLWTGIAYAIAKMIFKLPRLKILFSRFSAFETGVGQFIGWALTTLIFTIGTMALYWYLDPFNRKVTNEEEERIEKQSLSNTEINYVGLYGSLPNGITVYQGRMDEIPIELSILKDAGSSSIIGEYHNLKQHTNIMLNGDELLEGVGDITLSGTERKRKWVFVLTGDVENVSGTALSNNKKYTITLKKKVCSIVSAINSAIKKKQELFMSSLTRKIKQRNQKSVIKRHSTNQQLKPVQQPSNDATTPSSSGTGYHFEKVTQPPQGVSTSSNGTGYHFEKVEPETTP